ncbi:NADPH2:quinone reductase [Inquilinus ginsengisoli]|uniref:NADPH2:quinone reductase n=1 Tax=Inquilinus ginsengisoli TaxID=363840 RepID=A0ABU1JYF0_9PROT|nr:quinone oxidoreductase [Inquilinus ginsengisoli]MDR6293662.1 NADPH2:quinone reductase [Inquilinus ginsengisoli]
MVHAIRIHETGGPDILRWEAVEVPAPAEGELRIRHTAIGLNYIDTYIRDGLYKTQLPLVLGQEAAGEVLAVGPGVTGFKPGDRVAYGNGPTGSYAEERVIPAEKVVKIPDGVNDRTAAAIMLKGLTSWYLLRRTFPVQPGQTILFHAAAGGVGQIACQWAKHLGATVIGTAGGPEKVALARANGCDHVIDYSSEDFVARVRAITGGKGVPVVYDGVGKTTFEGSLDCLSPRGMMVTFGNASGPVAPISPLVLSQKGSLYLTRPTLATYIAARSEYEAAAAELFDVVAKGAVKISINQTYPLRETAQAHRDLEARKTTGSTVLLP